MTATIVVTIGMVVTGVRQVGGHNTVIMAVVGYITSRLRRHRHALITGVKAHRAGMRDLLQAIGMKAHRQEDGMTVHLRVAGNGRDPAGNITS